MTLNTLSRTALGILASVGFLATSAGFASAAPAPEPGTPTSLGSNVSTTFPALDTSHAGDLSFTDVGRMDSHGSFIPVGANHWDCKPSTAHPNPVILLNGFGGENAFTYIGLAPSLKAAGFCVFSLDWGAAPATHGTDMGGKLDQKTAFGRLAVDVVDKIGYSGIKDLLPYSDFVREVSTPSLTRPDVQYAVLATTGDTTVTPWQSQFLSAGPNVQNYLLQDLCPKAKADHVGITLNIVFLQVVQDFLAGKMTPIVCSVSNTTPVALHQYVA